MCIHVCMQVITDNAIPVEKETYPGLGRWLSGQATCIEVWKPESRYPKPI